MDRKEAIEIVRKNYPHVGISDSEFESALRELVPELNESEDERIRLEIHAYLFNTLHNTQQLTPRTNELERWLAYLERQKEPQHAIRVTKGFGDPDGPQFELVDLQKEQQPAKDTALQEAFINSKIDYTLEEKCDASDYAEVILPTSVSYGENEEEHKLHKIIEAAFIAGQKKEEQPAEWSDEDKRTISEVVQLIEDGALDRGEKDFYINRLKSLRPQPHWKPSEEQMEALKDAFRKDGGNEYRKVINSLYRDLEKLL